MTKKNHLSTNVNTDASVPDIPGIHEFFLITISWYHHMALKWPFLTSKRKAVFPYDPLAGSINNEISLPSCLVISESFLSSLV